MKAIVAEIDKKQMIVITDKGDFVKVKRQMSAGIGDEIELKPQKTYLAYRRLAGMAACFLACILLSTGVYAYYTPYSYVSVDINPSIALSLNRFERVISVDPLNEDGASLIKDAKNLKNQDIDEALSEIIKSASDKGYINEETENQVMVVVSAKNPKEEKELKDTVTAAASKELSKVNDNYGIMVEKTSVENYKNALSNKVSPGKKILADKLRAVIPEIKDEEIKAMSVKEAVHLIKEGRKEIKAAEKNGNGNNKDKDKNRQNINSKDNKKQNGTEAVKAASDAKGNKKKDDKVKPAAAASKKTDEANTAEDEKAANIEDNEDDKNKDIEDQKKKDKVNGNENNSNADELEDDDGNGAADDEDDNDNGNGDESSNRDNEKEKGNRKKGD